MTDLLAGFERSRIRTSGAEIAVARAGDGPPVLLLHGWPQTMSQWHRVAPLLTRRFTVVVTDLRGHGDSEKPPGGEGHAAYAKRAMALDQVEVMQALGFESFALVGHDRGARVAHRLALDHPERVTRLTLLDIAPTLAVYRSLTKESCEAAFHWFFLVQPYPLPERLVGGDPEFFLRWCLRAWSAGRDDFFDPAAVAEYVRCFSDPVAIHSTTEDIRALASIDVEHDLADEHLRITCPLLVLWGARGKKGDLRDAWRERATEVNGRGLPCGHFLAEELPVETAAELESFLA